VSFTLNPLDDLSYIGIDGRRVLESGDFYLGVGHEVDCRYVGVGVCLLMGLGCRVCCVY
jgi:hypothetical protein